MEDKRIILNEVAVPVEGDEKAKVSIEEVLPKKPKSNLKNNGYKTKKCKVIAYNKNSKLLDIYFDGYGIRVKNVDKVNDDFIDIRYKGEIGKPNFEYKI